MSDGAWSFIRTGPVVRSSNDLAQATELATKMVREYGLSAALGPIGYPRGGAVYLPGSGPDLSSRPFAEATQARIDGEVAHLLREAETRALDLLTEHRPELEELVKSRTWTERTLGRGPAAARARDHRR